jgi:Replication factor A protein 3
MNTDNAAPRVGFPQLKNLIGQRVTFVGRIETMEGGVVQMAAPDGSRVSVQASSPYDTQYAEVIGTVLDPSTIREETHVNFGDNFGAPTPHIPAHADLHSLPGAHN